MEVSISALGSFSIPSFWEWTPVFFHAWWFPSSKVSHFYHRTLGQMFVHYSMQGFPSGPRRVSENSRKLGKFGEESESGQVPQSSTAPELISTKSLEEEALILKESIGAAKTRISSVLFVVKTTVLRLIESKIGAQSVSFSFMYVKACTFNYK